MRIEEEEEDRVRPSRFARRSTPAPRQYSH